MSSVYLNQFQSILPKNCVKQEDSLAWLTRCHQLAEVKNDGELAGRLGLIEKLFSRYGVQPAQISKRYSDSDDFLSAQISTDFSSNRIYNFELKNSNGVGIGERTRVFAENADEVFKKFYDVDTVLKRPDHIVHVTCTGYISPSAAQKIVTEKLWNQNTAITHAYHMGCYAALPSIRIAQGLVMSEKESNPQFLVDMVHTEMCSLHMNALAHTPEQVVVQSLFGDGYIKYSAMSEPVTSSKNFKIVTILEKVIPDSQQDMSWVPAPWGMEMNLSREIPGKIKGELKTFSEELFKKAHLEPSKALKSVFAVHPGGPSIIDAVQNVLELSDEQVSASRKILFERGNMSSATLPHVWKEILERNYPIGTNVISYAFGPGLTMFGSVFEIC